MTGDQFFEMSLDLLAVAGFDGYLKRVNPSWTRTLGWSTEELLARPSLELVHPDDRDGVRASRDTLMQGTPLLGLVNRYRCKDGSYRWFEWRSIADLDQQVVYAAARDITEARAAREERSEMQRQLMFADRMASVGTLAAGVAHEINNPLAYVMGNLQVLTDTLPGDGAITAAQRAEWVEIATEALEGAERIRKTVRGLKTFSRADEEHLLVTELPPVLDLAVDMTLNEIRHRARLVKSYGPVPLVEVDDARLGQVFLNLLVNAAQALPEGSAPAHEIEIATLTDSEGRAVIEVRDTGPGIPPHLLGRIFDPFFTTKPVGVGTGLGLWISHQIVTALGGSITAANRPRGGAVLRVVLPASTAVRPVAPAPAPVVAAPGRRASILVVDDDRSVGLALARVLRAHQVTVVTSAKAALALALGDRPFDLILSDLMMPEMSGMELHDTLARQRPELARRMAFVTGGTFTAAADAFLERVPNERLEKPFDARVLRALVDKLVAT